MVNPMEAVIAMRSAFVEKGRVHPNVKTALEKRGIVVRAASSEVLAEEADLAYKNVDVVAEVSDRIGIATKVARLVPIAVVKG